MKEEGQSLKSRIVPKDKGIFFYKLKKKKRNQNMIKAESICDYFSCYLYLLVIS